MLLILLVFRNGLLGSVLPWLSEHGRDEHGRHGDDVLGVIEVHVRDILDRLPVRSPEHHLVRTGLKRADILVGVVAVHPGIHAAVVLGIIDLGDKVIRISAQHIHDFLGESVFPVHRGNIGCGIVIVLAVAAP